MQPDSKSGWATMIGAFTSIFSGISVHEWGVIIGIIIGLAGLVSQQYWAWRKQRHVEAVARERLRKECGVTCIADDE